MKYVYGVVPSQQVRGRQLHLTGLQGALQTVACNGHQCHRQQAVPYDYASLPKQQLVKVLAQHQQATEHIMQETATLLPVVRYAAVRNDVE
ncbi:MAG: GvpL/GvpF family gas vesicle protein [Caldilineaceae bacterium]